MRAFLRRALLQAGIASIEARAPGTDPVFVPHVAGHRLQSRTDRLVDHLPCGNLLAFSMSGSAVTVEKAAYLKLMLHAAKYPWASVSGFLLGESGSSEEQVTVKDAVPLFHTSTLAPLLETSAAMVDAHAAKNGLSIVGFYQANQCLDDNGPSLLATKIMDKIDLANGGSSVLLLISNKRLETKGDSAVSAFARDASSSFRKHLEVGVSSKSIEAFESALTKRVEIGLVDMDEHLDDVTKDWRNPGIVSA